MFTQGMCVQELQPGLKFNSTLKYRLNIFFFESKHDYHD